MFDYLCNNNNNNNNNNNHNNNNNNNNRHGVFAIAENAFLVECRIPISETEGSVCTTFDRNRWASRMPALHRKAMPPWADTRPSSLARMLISHPLQQQWRCYWIDAAARSDGSSRGRGFSTWLDSTQTTRAHQARRQPLHTEPCVYGGAETLTASALVLA